MPNNVKGERDRHGEEGDGFLGVWGGGKRNIERKWAGGKREVGA